MKIKLIVYLLVYLGIPILIGLSPNETVQSILAIIYIFLLIPFAILKAIDFYRNNSGVSRNSRVFNILFRVPLTLFGLLCVIAGISIVVWVLYNVFIHRYKEYSGPNFITGLGSFGIAVPLTLFGIAMLRSAIHRPTRTIEKFKDENNESNK